MKTLLLTFGFLVVAPLAQAADADRSAARTIVLVRHGNYVADDSVDGKIGPHLSSLGVAQAYLVGARLRDSAAGFDHLYVSPMQRARDTAAAIAPEFPQRRFEVIDDLAECTPPTRSADIMAREKPADLAACKEKLDREFDRFFTVGSMINYGAQPVPSWLDCIHCFCDAIYNANLVSHYTPLSRVAGASYSARANPARRAFGGGPVSISKDATTMQAAG